MALQEAPGGEPDQDAALLDADQAAKLATAEGLDASADISGCCLSCCYIWLVPLADISGWFLWLLYLVGASG